MWSTIYSLIASDRKRGGGYESQWTRPTQGLVENSSFSLYCLIGCSSSISDRNNNYKAWSLTSSYTHIGIQAHTSDLESPVQGCFSPSSSLSNTHRPRHKYTDATGCYHSDVTVVGSYGS